MTSLFATKRGEKGKLRVHENCEKVLERATKAVLAGIKRSMEHRHFREVIYLVLLDFYRDFQLSLLRIKRHHFTPIHKDILPDSLNLSNDGD